jgi:integrase
LVRPHLEGIKGGRQIGVAPLAPTGGDPMAISLICQSCKRTHSLGTIQCTCGRPLAKYKVRVRTPKGKWKTRQTDDLPTAERIEAEFKSAVKPKSRRKTAPADSPAPLPDPFETTPNAPTLSHIWPLYLEWAKANKSSWKADETVWRLHIKPVIGSIPMRGLTPFHVESVMTKMKAGRNHRGQPFAPSTVHKSLVITKRLFNWSIRRELYQGRNPAALVDPPKYDNRVTNALKPDEVQAFLELVDRWNHERAKLVVKFALWTGKRLGEIVGLEWSDVDLDSGTIHIRPENAKSGRGSTLPVNAPALEVLNRALAIRKGRYVFPSRSGEYFHSTFCSAWQRFKKRHDLGFRFHDLRHTYATMLANSGRVDIYTLQTLLGHASVEMTQRYAHLLDGSLRKAVGVLDGMA